MRLRNSFAVALASGALACASAGPGGADADEGGGEITVVVANEFNLGVTAYAVWEGNRVRLGEVSASRTRTFRTLRRSNRIALGLQVNAPPAGTGAGPTRFGGGAGTGPDPSAPYVSSEPIDIVVGDGIEWTLGSTGVLLYRRLSADPNDATPVGPR
jgi:hypothetical protein